MPSLTDSAVSLSALLDEPAGRLFVAETDTGIVGTVIAAWDGWRGSFSKLAVRPEWRRRGVASALVAAGEAHLRAAGARRLSAIVLLDGPEAAEFWRAAGFEHQAGAGRFTRSC